MHIENIGQSVSLNLKNIAFLRFKSLSTYENIISPFTRMYYISEGSGYLILEGKRIELEAGYLYLIPRLIPCTYVFEKQLAHYYVHFVTELTNGLNIYNLFSFNKKVKALEDDQRFFEKLLELNPGYELPHHDPKVYQKKPWINKQITFKTLGHYLETTGMIKVLYSRFIKNELTEQVSKLPTHKIYQTFSYIQQNLNQEITVDQLADQACLSRDHYSRTFKRITGLGPREFIINKKIENAKLFLLSTDYPLKKIIERSGFKTTAYFCRIFKKYTSYTPEEFRKQKV